MRFLPWGLLLAAWAATLWIAGGLADGPARWLSAHTLQAFLGYDRWGVLATLGANLVLPAGPETAGVDLRALAKSEGAYLSYPTLWAVALWPVARGEAGLAWAGLVLVRLGGSLAAFAALREAGRIMGARPVVAAAAALAGAAFWLASPSMLWYSRYELFADQFCLPAAYAATAIALRARLRLDGLSRGSAWGLAAAGLFAWGSEWLGWLVMGAIALGFAWRSWGTLPGATPEAKAGAFLRRSACLWAPMVLAVGMFAVQLVAYHAAWGDLVATFERRALRRTADDGQALAGAVIAARIVGHAAHNLPGFLQAGMVELVGWLLGARPFAPAALGPPIAAAVGVAGAIVAWRAAPDRRLAGAAIALVVAPPLVHTLALQQHSAIHEFSGVRAALPLALGLVTLPLLALGRRLGDRAIAGLAAVLAVALLAGARPAALAFVPRDNGFVADMKALVAAEVGPADLPVSGTLAFDTMQAAAAYNVGRLVYAPGQLAAIAPKLDPAALGALTPVVLEFADAAPRSPYAALVKGRWRPVSRTVMGRAVVAARLPEMRGKLAAWAAAETATR